MVSWQRLTVLVSLGKDWPAVLRGLLLLLSSFGVVSLAIQVRGRPLAGVGCIFFKVTGPPRWWTIDLDAHRIRLYFRLEVSPAAALGYSDFFWFLVHSGLLSSRVIIIVIHFICSLAPAQVWDDWHGQLDRMHAVLKLVVVLASSASAEARDGRLYFPLLLACAALERPHQVVAGELLSVRLFIIKVLRQAPR